MKIFSLGLYTARLELFKLCFVFACGFLIYSSYLYFRYSGSLSRKRKKTRALIMMIVSGLAILFMGVSWLLSRTNYGWWFDKL
jgi:hypothetical protein